MGNIILNKIKSIPWEIKYPLVFIIIIWLLVNFIGSAIYGKFSINPVANSNNTSSVSEKALSNFAKTKFLVARSSFENGSYSTLSANVANYDVDGNYLGSLDIDDAYNLAYFEKSKNGTNLYSYNWNNNLAFTNNGVANLKIFQDSNSDFKNKNSGVEYITKNENWSVKEVNVGYVDNKYILLFDVLNLKNSESYTFELKEYFPITNLGIDGSNLYFITRKLPDISSGELLVNYDLDNKKTLSEVALSNIFENKGTFEINTHIGIFIQGTNLFLSGTNNDEKLTKMLFKASLVTSKLVKSTNISGNDDIGIVSIEKIENKLYVLYSDSSVKIFDLELNLINSYKVVQDSNIVVTGLNQALNTSFIDDGIGYLITNYFTIEAQSERLQLTKFDISDGHVVQNYSFKNPPKGKDSDKQNTFLVVPL